MWLSVTARSRGEDEIEILTNAKTLRQLLHILVITRVRNDAEPVELPGCLRPEDLGGNQVAAVVLDGDRAELG